MELSQSRREAQGSKSTHDFLSLYSPVQQDPTPTIPGGYLKTHDFLQPLDQQFGKEGNKFDQILHRGMTTYSISEISSYMNQIQSQSQSQSQTVPKAEGIETQSSSSNNNDENSNSSSYTGSGFMILEESNVNKGKTGKIGMPWMTSCSTSVNAGQTPNSPRSKHSATEQRRRSKINDRFSLLRGIIPHGDQKRDKASFLLEVIEYIQFLQEKVHTYEDSHKERNKKPPNMISLNNKLTNQPQFSNVSSMYSQGISSALTQALKSSGVDLSETDISVQIDLGKRSNTNLKENETPLIEESGEGLKRRRK